MNNAYAKTSQWWWLISPYNFNAYNAHVRGGSGTTYDYHVGVAGAVRPSISLASATTFTGGTGSYDDPYVIE